MTWTETHARWAALREVETLAAADPDGELPWSEQYAELFGDRAALLAALRYRWRVAELAQLDPELEPEELAERRRYLADRETVVRRLLARAAATNASPGAQHVGA